MAINFGPVPAESQLHLVRDADFVQQITTADGTSWPTGATLRFEVGSLVWDATFNADIALFNVDKSITNTVLDETETTLRYFDTAGLELTLARGPVVRHDD